MLVSVPTFTHFPPSLHSSSSIPKTLHAICLQEFYILTFSLLAFYSFQTMFYHVLKYLIILH